MPYYKKKIEESILLNNILRLFNNVYKSTYNQHFRKSYNRREMQLHNNYNIIINNYKFITLNHNSEIDFCYIKKDNKWNRKSIHMNFLHKNISCISCYSNLVQFSQVGSISKLHLQDINCNLLKLHKLK